MYLLFGHELQVESINDISESSQRSGTTGRMLRLRLTDGHLFLTAIEYRPIPSLSLDIPTGTKVASVRHNCALLITILYS